MEHDESCIQTQVFWLFIKGKTNDTQTFEVYKISKKPISKLNERQHLLTVCVREELTPVSISRELFLEI